MSFKLKQGGTWSMISASRFFGGVLARIRYDLVKRGCFSLQQLVITIHVSMCRKGRGIALSVCMSVDTTLNEVAMSFTCTVLSVNVHSK